MHAITLRSTHAYTVHHQPPPCFNPYPCHFGPFLAPPICCCETRSNTLEAPGRDPKVRGKGSTADEWMNSSRAASTHLLLDSAGQQHPRGAKRGQTQRGKGKEGREALGTTDKGIIVCTLCTPSACTCILSTIYMSMSICIFLSTSVCPTLAPPCADVQRLE